MRLVPTAAAQITEQQKYGAHVKDYITTFENRFNDLSTYVLGGEGIDFFPGDDVYDFPKGVISGMFQPVDDYIDVNSPLWQNTKEGMEIFNFGGKHFAFVTGITAEQVCIYNTAAIEENGVDDPWDLYEAGEWNWDTFKKMLEDFVDEENGMYVLGGYFYEKALWTSAGTVAVDNVDGHVKSMLNGAATMAGFTLCKGAKNPEGVALYAECNIVGSIDPDTVAVSDRKNMDDNGCSTDVADYTVNDLAIGE